MWKDIKDYEGLYEINSSGHIRRKGSAKLLKQAKGKDYMQVSLCKCNHKVTKQFIDQQQKLSQKTLMNYVVLIIKMKTS